MLSIINIFLATCRVTSSSAVRTTTITTHARRQRGWWCSLRGSRAHLARSIRSSDDDGDDDHDAVTLKKKSDLIKIRIVVLMVMMVYYYKSFIWFQHLIHSVSTNWWLSSSNGWCYKRGKSLKSFLLNDGDGSDCFIKARDGDNGINKMHWYCIRVEWFIKEV